MISQRCLTCGDAFDAPRRRAYCSRACWPSEVQPADVDQSRQELEAEAAGGSVIAELILRKLDEMEGR
jgi:hypothetical protein